MTPQLPSPEVLRLVAPELVLIGTMCAVILVPLAKRGAVGLQALVAAGGLLLALAAALATLPQLAQFVQQPAEPPAALLGGMLTIDPFSQGFKVLLLLFASFVVLQWWVASRQETMAADTPDFLCLLVGATLGMSLMASASNLLMIFLATESASLPSFALAGFRKGHKSGSEAALKYVLFGAAAAAVMLYGMSLIYGCTGALDLTGIAQRAAAPGAGISPLLALGLLCLLAGIAFKLSAVPMHFWCPDVFEGAPIAVTTFLSVASKGAAVCLLVRVLESFGAAAASPGAAHGFAALTVGVAIFGAATATWGNLVAYHQNNLKRMLAYSSIAHAGYMIMAASLLPVAGGPGPQAAEVVTGAVLFYLLVYLFMNLGAFTVAALVSRAYGVEDLRDYAGLIGRAPMLAVLLTLFLLSLFGMPGFGGFMAKIYLMSAMAHAAGAWGFVLIGVLLFNTLISLYFYMRPVYYMMFRAGPEGRGMFVPRGAGIVLLAFCAAALVWTGVVPGWAVEQTSAYATLLPGPAVAGAAAK